MTQQTKRRLILVSMTLASLVTAGAVVAGPGRARGPCWGDCDRCGMGGPARGPRAILSHLDLTADQKGKVAAILEESRDRVTPLAEEARKSRLALRDAIHAPEIEESKVRAASEAAGQARTALDLERARTIASIREVLTPAQRAEMEAMRARFKEKAMERRGRRGGPGPRW